MQSETVQALRALAKQLGLSGYSRLRKEELLKLIAAHNPKAHRETVTGSLGSGLRAAALREEPRRSSGKPTASAATHRVPATSAAPLPSSVTDAEQHIESAKYELAPSGTGAQEPLYASGLAEDIERMPEIRESELCLLPQKPGMLHGYWVLPPPLLGALQSIRLRLAHYAGNRLTLLEEHTVSAGHGHWYFHVDEEMESGTIYLQLGRYRPDGEFVSILERGIARIPSLYPSSLTDRRWWLSDSEFRAMYRRAGGAEYGARLGWAGSTGSPSGSRYGSGSIGNRRQQTA